MNFCHHVGMFTNHPERLIRFYTEKLGFQKSSPKQVPQNIMESVFQIPSPCELLKLMKGQVVLEIFSCPGCDFKKRNPQAMGYNHWALIVEDKNSFLQGVQRKGVELIRADNKGRDVWFVKDPDGNLIEIYERRKESP